ncbi:MAG: hypothetical protein RJB01_1400 [Actinomycetota bacterium]|jgi:hypothetical protein
MDDRQTQIQGAIDALVARANADPVLSNRLMADAKATIEAETGMVVPSDWDLVAVIQDDGIVFELLNDELPEEYLQLVSGGWRKDGTYECPCH